MAFMYDAATSNVTKVEFGVMRFVLHDHDRADMASAQMTGQIVFISCGFMRIISIRHFFSRIVTPESKNI